MKKEYWFFIDTYVHISVKKSTVLFYNSYNGKILRYSDNPAILKLTRRLLAPKNLRIIRLREEDFDNPSIREFVGYIREYFMGDVIDISLTEGKPIQTPPTVKIQKDVKYLAGDESRSVGEDLMQYLSEVSLYITNRCGLDCDICTRAYRQFPCCTKGKSKIRDLDIEDIKGLVHEVKGCLPVNLNILGGDIFMYPKWEELLAVIAPLQTGKTYFLHYLNAVTHRHRLKVFNGSGSRLKIPVNLPVDEGKLKIAADTAAALEVDTVFGFIIRDENDFEKVETLLSQVHIDNPEFHAFYDGTNLDFFQENIFVDEEEIESVRPSLQDIHARGKVNPLKFGHLLVSASGHILADVNASSLGILGKHSLYDIVLKEMSGGISWRKSRTKVMPCKRCTFEMLCPPITGYNTVIGKNNLCRIFIP